VDNPSWWRGRGVAPPSRAAAFATAPTNLPLRPTALALVLIALAWPVAALAWPVAALAWLVTAAEQRQFAAAWLVAAAEQRQFRQECGVDGVHRLHAALIQTNQPT
jgi:hypothetical protein